MSSFPSAGAGSAPSTPELFNLPTDEWVIALARHLSDMTDVEFYACVSSYFDSDRFKAQYEYRQKTHRAHFEREKAYLDSPDEQSRACIAFTRACYEHFIFKSIYDDVKHPFYLYMCDRASRKTVDSTYSSFGKQKQNQYKPLNAVIADQLGDTKESLQEKLKTLLTLYQIAKDKKNPGGSHYNALKALAYDRSLDYLELKRQAVYYLRNMLVSANDYGEVKIMIMVVRHVFNILPRQSELISRQSSLNQGNLFKEIARKPEVRRFMQAFYAASTYKEKEALEGVTALSFCKVTHENTLELKNSSKAAPGAGASAGRMPAVSDDAVDMTAKAGAGESGQALSSFADIRRSAIADVKRRFALKVYAVEDEFCLKDKEEDLAGVFSQTVIDRLNPAQLKALFLRFTQIYAANRDIRCKFYTLAYYGGKKYNRNFNQAHDFIKACDAPGQNLDALKFDMASVLQGWLLDTKTNFAAAVREVLDVQLFKGNAEKLKPVSASESLSRRFKRIHALLLKALHHKGFGLESAEKEISTFLQTQYTGLLSKISMPVYVDSYSVGVLRCLDKAFTEGRRSHTANFLTELLMRNAQYKSTAEATSERAAKIKTLLDSILPAAGLSSTLLEMAVQPSADVVPVPAFEFPDDLLSVSDENPSGPKAPEPRFCDVKDPKRQSDFLDHYLKGKTTSDLVNLLGDIATRYAANHKMTQLRTKRVGPLSYSPFYSPDHTHSSRGANFSDLEELLYTIKGVYGHVSEAIQPLVKRHLKRWLSRTGEDFADAVRESLKVIGINGKKTLAPRKIRDQAQYDLRMAIASSLDKIEPSEVVRKFESVFGKGDETVLDLKSHHGLYPGFLSIGPTVMIRSYVANFIGTMTAEFMEDTAEGQNDSKWNTYRELCREFNLEASFAGNPAFCHIAQALKPQVVVASAPAVEDVTGVVVGVPLPSAPPVVVDGVALPVSRLESQIKFANIWLAAYQADPQAKRVKDLLPTVTSFEGVVNHVPGLLDAIEAVCAGMATTSTKAVAAIAQSPVVEEKAEGVSTPVQTPTNAALANELKILLLKRAKAEITAGGNRADVIAGYAPLVRWLKTVSETNEVPVIFLQSEHLSYFAMGDELVESAVALINQMQSTAVELLEMIGSVVQPLSSDAYEAYTAALVDAAEDVSLAMFSSQLPEAPQGPVSAPVSPTVPFAAAGVGGAQATAQLLEPA